VRLIFNRKVPFQFFDLVGDESAYLPIIIFDILYHGYQVKGSPKALL